MQIRVLGCSGGVGQGRATTSFLVDRDVLIDAGTGACELALDELNAVQDIFVTHAHLDHIAAIPLLADTLFDQLVDRPIRVHGLQKTLDVLHRHIFNGQIWPDFTILPHPDRPVLRLQSIQPGSLIEIDGRLIEAIEVSHTVPAAAYRVEAGGRSFAFSGDTTSNRALWAALNRHPELDLLFVESAFANKDLELATAARHYCPELLALDLRQLKHQPAVCISHLKPGEEALIMKECREALPQWQLKQLRSGDVFEL